MTNVTLTIAGRDYAVACAAGEEAHVHGLGAMINTKLQAMGTTAGHSETRDLLFATLLLADEVHELKQRSPAMPDRASDPASSATQSDDGVAETLEALATRLENCAAALEG